MNMCVYIYIYIYSYIHISLSLSLSLSIYIYIYTYIHRALIYLGLVYLAHPLLVFIARTSAHNPHMIFYGGLDIGFTPNLPTNIVDFRGFDSSIISILRGGIPRPIGIS